MVISNATRVPIAGNNARMAKSGVDSSVDPAKCASVCSHLGVDVPIRELTSRDVECWRRKKKRRWAAPRCVPTPFALLRAERAGFEPAVQHYLYTDLANRRYRPLSHLSGGPGNDSH